MDRLTRTFRVLGAYGCGVLSVIYLVLQKLRGLAQVDGTLWKWSFAALNIGLVGMVGALLVSGFAQAFVERAIGGSTHDAFVAGQENAWFVEGMVTRFIFGLVFAAGYLILVCDLLTLGRRALPLPPSRPPNERAQSPSVGIAPGPLCGVRWKLPIGLRAFASLGCNNSSAGVHHFVRIALSCRDRRRRVDALSNRLEGADRCEQRRISRDPADHLALSPAHP